MTTDQEQMQAGSSVEHQLQHAGAEHPDFPGSLESIISQEQALALQHIHAFHQSMPLITPPNFPRPTVKRRKPVKWESWEEKNLIEGVRRFGRGNWAQIRAAFEFNQCRTNVDLHDKWRVLTGERKRNRQAQRLSSPQSPANSPTIPAEQQQHDQQQQQLIQPEGEVEDNGEAAQQNGANNNQKVQLIPVAGTNGLYTLSSFLPPGFNPASLMEGNGLPFPDFLQQMQQSDLMAQQGQNEHHHHQQEADLAAAVTRHAEEEAAAAAAVAAGASSGGEEQHVHKRVKKLCDENEIAQELLKLSKAEADEEQDESSGDDLRGNLSDDSKKAARRARNNRQ